MACIQYGRNALRKIIKDTTLHPSDQMMQPLLFTGQGVRHRKLEVILTTVSMWLHFFIFLVWCLIVYFYAQWIEYFLLCCLKRALKNLGKLERQLRSPLDTFGTILCPRYWLFQILKSMLIWLRSSVGYVSSIWIIPVTFDCFYIRVHW